MTRGIERIESRLLCWTAPGLGPEAQAWTSAEPVFSTFAADAAAAVPAYNTAFLTDAQLEDAGAMTAAEVRAFLAGSGSYFRQTITDVDGVSFDPAAVVAQAAQQYRISPKVLLATLQKEHSGVTRTTRPSDAQLAFLMGCRSSTTARDQLACAAERFRSYQDSLARTGSTVSGWRVGVAKTTQDGVSVTPATRAVAGQFTYTPYAGVQWGGNVAGVGGVYLFYDAWNAFGFFDSARPTAALSDAPDRRADGSAGAYTFSVTFADDAAVDASDVVSNNNAVRVTGPNKFSRLATFLSLDPAADGSPLRATYRIAPPGGTWDTADVGAYTVSVAEAQVSDVHNNFVAAGAIGSFNVRAPAAVVSRGVAYHGSAFGDATAPDKQALLPGLAATAANVTSYTRGVNAVTIDLTGLPATGATPGLADFAFRSAKAPNPSIWAQGPAATSVALVRGAGLNGSDRIVLTWPDYVPGGVAPAGQAVANGWLEVTLKATADTGLASPDVFCFGNLIGETGDDTTAPMRVTSADYAGTRAALASPSPIDGRYDFDRDGEVTALDLLTARRNLLTSLPAPPAAFGAPLVMTFSRFVSATSVTWASHRLPTALLDETRAVP